MGECGVQLELFSFSERDLYSEVRKFFGENVDMTLTDNRSSILSYKPGSESHPDRLRIHRMFLLADPETVRAAFVWLKSPRARRAGTRVDTFIRAHEYLLTARTPRHRLRTQGEHHHLEPFFAELNEVEFENRVDAAITWGPARRPKRMQRSIRLGSYSQPDHLIRINPRLDHEKVPPFFVKYIVFHEMLHADMGVSCDNEGRRQVHSPEFLAREKLYDDYECAVAWQDRPKNLAYLLGSRSSPP